MAAENRICDEAPRRGGGRGWEVGAVGKWTQWGNGGGGEIGVVGGGRDGESGVVGRGGLRGGEVGCGGDVGAVGTSGWVWESAYGTEAGHGRLSVRHHPRAVPGWDEGDGALGG
jgi:hypothetical protein